MRKAPYISTRQSNDVKSLTTHRSGICTYSLSRPAPDYKRGIKTLMQEFTTTDAVGKAHSCVILGQEMDKPSDICTLEPINNAFQRIHDFARKNEIGKFPVSGDCLEGAGVNDGDILVVDLRKMPRQPLYKDKHGVDRRDICLCMAGKEPILMFKEYMGIFGGYPMVGTKYKDRLNHAFPTILIYGVVQECRTSDDKLKWTRDISDCPLDLDSRDTIPIVYI